MINNHYFSTIQKNKIHSKRIKSSTFIKHYKFKIKYNLKKKLIMQINKYLKNKNNNH